MGTPLCLVFSSHSRLAPDSRVSMGRRAYCVLALRGNEAVHRTPSTPAKLVSETYTLGTVYTEVPKGWVEERDDMP